MYLFMTVIKIDDPQYARIDSDGLFENEATLGRALAAMSDFLGKSSSSFFLSEKPVGVDRLLLDDILAVLSRTIFFFLSPDTR